MLQIPDMHKQWERLKNAWQSSKYKQKAELLGKPVFIQAVLAFILIFLLLFGGLFVWNVLNPVQLKSSSPRAELGEPYDPKDNIAYVFLSSPDQVQISGRVNTLLPGTYEIDYNYKGRIRTIEVEVQDTQAPVLEVHDVTAQIDEEVDADSFIDSIKDASKVSVTIRNPEALEYKAGTRNVILNAIDEYGNKTSRTVRLTRLKDSEPPTVEPLPVARFFPVNSEFTPLDLIVTDNTDPNPTVEVNTNGLNMSSPGTYIIAYIVSDCHGNHAQYNETIYVVVHDDPPASDIPQEELQDLAEAEMEEPSYEEAP